MFIKLKIAVRSIFHSKCSVLSRIDNIVMTKLTTIQARLPSQSPQYLPAPLKALISVVTTNLGLGVAQKKMNYRNHSLINLNISTVVWGYVCKCVTLFRCVSISSTYPGEGCTPVIFYRFKWALPVRGGLNACQDGLGHLFREELPMFKWAFAWLWGGQNACQDGLGHLYPPTR